MYKIEYVDTKSLKENPKNRNKHSKYQIKRLSEIVNYQGFRVPIIVSRQSGFIVAGHGRLESAKKNKLEKVPVIYQDFENEEQEYAFQVSDNAISSWAELDLSGINDDVPSLGPDFNIDMLGIKDFQIDVSDKINESNNDILENKCPKCGYIAE